MSAAFVPRDTWLDDQIIALDARITRLEQGIAACGTIKVEAEMRHTVADTAHPKSSAFRDLERFCADQRWHTSYFFSAPFNVTYLDIEIPLSADLRSLHNRRSLTIPTVPAWQTHTAVYPTLIVHVHPLLAESLLLHYKSIFSTAHTVNEMRQNYGIDPVPDPHRDPEISLTEAYGNERRYSRYAIPCGNFLYRLWVHLVVWWCGDDYVHRYYVKRGGTFPALRQDDSGTRALEMAYAIEYDVAHSTDPDLETYLFKGKA